MNDVLSREVYRKVTLRLVPFLTGCFVLAFLDRINIGFAQLQMKHGLSMSDTAFGLAGSAFFLGFLLFEIPSNLLLQKIGAKKTLSSILILWGLVSASTMFVATAYQFQVLRFFLGVFEAGFSPGVFLYLTYWYPPARQGRMVGLYMTGALVAGLIAGPVSTSIMIYWDSVAGLRGWQWLFVLEGLPSIAAGIVAYFYLTNRPSQASWLDAEQKAFLHEQLRVTLDDQAESADAWHKVFVDSRALLFAFCVLTTQCGAYVIFLWMPQILKAMPGVSISELGYYTIVPYLLAMIVMYLYGKHSDQTLERRWHFAAAQFIAAGGFLIVMATHHPIVTTIAFALSMSGLMSATVVSWAAIGAALPISMRPAGIALISSVGSIGGLISPTLVGYSRDLTGNANAGLFVISLLIVFGGACMVAFYRTTVRMRPALA